LTIRRRSSSFVDLARAPERLTPSSPAEGCRLRWGGCGQGEVRELRTDELLFDLQETTRLFNETSGRDLDADVLVDLTDRTEGWAARCNSSKRRSDRSPGNQRFIHELNGADHELYDYLAEEVVGDLPEDLQQFLMETALLQVVTPELAVAVSGLDQASAARLHLRLSA
jgi:LuxR family maltose regulon positive regulatory protein